MDEANIKKLHKIGEVAEAIGISVPTLRMYEREGILIPIKSEGGTRYFDDSDITWIKCIRRMISELGLNIEGIRRLLALIPCWELKECAHYESGRCQVISDSTKPCWMNRLAQTKTDMERCHDCVSYRYSINCENIKSLFQIRLRQLVEMKAGL